MPDRNQSNDKPITRVDLDAALDAALAAFETRILRVLASTEQRILDRTQEFVRDAQTELLRGFERYSAGESIQLRKLKADVTNIDASTDQRITLVENRLTQIERRLIIDPPTSQGSAS